MNRKRQQADIFFALGLFLGPVLRVAEKPDEFAEDEKQRIFARFFHDFDQFNGLLMKFCLTGEPGHKYLIQFQQAQQQLNAILNTGRRQTGEAILDVAKSVSDDVIATLSSIPIPLDSSIHEAHTPFSTYCFVTDLCSTVRTTLVWFDRYFDHTVFHRFLANTAPSVQITLVTLPVASAQSKSDTKRINDFMDVSKSFATERGVDGYRLMVNGAFHDRWLRCDNSLFTLGGSIKDLAKPFTISRLDSTPDNQKHFEDVVSSGTELFGHSHPLHP